ncbi:penicillin-binding transpeptidase domain-containing protein [Gemmatimonas sp.]|uniref:penicillin-binding transpeptidase domain-containing protein n=1 Tax=Gemmatimonas sp. TaxID=1962908 RepID=UPI003342DAF7
MSAAEDSADSTAPVLSRGRASFVHITLVLFGAAVVAKSAHVQLIEHDKWAQEAATQHVADVQVTPPRGAILDATGTVLVETREQVQIIVEPHNLRVAERKGADGKKRKVDSRVILRKALKDLRVPDMWVKRAFDRKKYKWVEIPQKFAPSDVERLRNLPGVVLRSQLTRINSTPQGLAGIVGVATATGNARSGLESELDEFLSGKEGRDSVVVDGRGRRIKSPMLNSVAARPGHNVTLTINQQLQEIAEEALANARQRTGATGGDVLILDPRDGAVLAIAGIRNGKAAYSGNGLTEAFEPGSVMKPFILARLLDLKRIEPDQWFNTYNGEWKYGVKKYSDTHKAERMTVRDIVRFSSNIGTVQASMQLSDGEEYEALRDFGFGVPTGVSYPSESRGDVKRPPYSSLDHAQMSIGYAMTATPLQIATAYAAIANGGELLEPSLVREVHDADGVLVYKHKRTVVRRVVSAEVSQLMRDMLKSVVDSGTSTAADMQQFDVGGKSGTARRVRDNGRGYEIGKYNSSFAGMFPVEKPQYVIVARLIDPVGTYYGGLVSGTMVNDLLQSAIATRDASLDRTELARLARPMPAPLPKPLTPEQQLRAEREAALFDSLKAPEPPKAEPLPMPSRIVVELPFAVTRDVRRKAEGEMRPIPSVYGLSARQAARTLYAAGFQVSVLEGSSVRTRPAAGALLRAGSTVQLETPK